MRWTLNLGKLLGVKIQVHWTFFLLLLWIVIAEYNRSGNTETIFFTALYILTIFFCVVLHEMGHILTARRYGIDTRKITLLPIGGVASLEKLPENPRQELIIAIAGPLVNVGIAAIIYPFLGDLETYLPDTAEQMATGVTAANFWFSLFVINLLLVVFNLIPAFPMDGGRALRALLAMNIGRVRATAIAAMIGQVLAAGFFFIGLFYNPLLALIGVFIFFGARGENYMVQQTELLKGHHVAEAMNTHFITLESSRQIQGVKEELISTCDDLFIVTSGTEIEGIVTRKDLLEAFRTHPDDPMTVRNLVSKEYESMRPGDNLSRIVAKIRTNGQSSFPVIDGNEIKGIISLDSIQRFLAVQGSLNY